MFHVRRRVPGVAGRVGVESVTPHTVQKVLVLLYVGFEGVWVGGAARDTLQLGRSVSALAAVAYQVVLALTSVLDRSTQVRFTAQSL